MLYLGSIYVLKAQGGRRRQKRAQMTPDASFGPKVRVSFFFFVFNIF